jgi:hypothetical protein
MRARGIAFAALLACFGSACVSEPGAGEPRPVRLALGLSSYATLPQIRDQLGSDLGWAITELKSPPRGTCPRFDHMTVGLPRRSVDGFMGRVGLEFVNGRLFRVEFFPDDIDAYVAWLRTQGTLFKAGTAFPAPGVVMFLTREPLSPASVGWGDMKLHDERRAWLDACTS